MFCPDVNVLIQAFRPEMPEHARCRGWLLDVIRKGESLALSSVALSGFVRVVTNPRAMPVPDPVEAALGFCDRLISAPAATLVHPGQRHWPIFARLCRETGAKANLVPDAWFAALAIEHACTWVTLDRDYARFSGLRVGEP
jgi:toxin-antitoxin system PIN domain toxin